MKAVTIRVQDPSFSNITSSPSSFSFSACPTASSPGGAYLDHGAAISADGCFGAVNESGDAISSIELTFQNTAAVQQSGAFDAQSDIFRIARFIAPRDTTDPNAQYTFLFSGSQLNQGETFVITEDGVSDPSLFPTVTLNYASATPEPGSFLLLGTGLLGAGCMYRRRLQA